MINGFGGATVDTIHEGQKLDNAIRFAMGTAALKCTGMGQENLPDRGHSAECPRSDNIDKNIQQIPRFFIYEYD